MAYEAGGAAAADTDTRRKIFIIVGVVAALMLAGLIYLITRPAATNTAEARLAGALRSGDPEFDAVREQVVLDSKEAFESPRAVGDIVMELRATARNFTGRTINGLEVHGTVIDSARNVVKERTVTVLPSGQTTQTEIEPNKTLPVRITLEGFKKSDDRANFRMELTGVRFK